MGADTQEIQAYTHDSFAVRDPHAPNDWIPQLAYKIEVSDDGRTYTLHLRDDVYWQIPAVEFDAGDSNWLAEPRKLTAEDGAFYFEMLMHPQTRVGVLKSYYRDLDTVEVVDEDTFKVTWKRATSQVHEFTVAAYPLPKWIYTRDRSGEALPKEQVAAKFHSHWANRYAVGTGPYSVATVENGRRIVLERNESYWGAKPPIETIEYQVIKDPNTAYWRLKGGELDLAQVPPPFYKKEVLDAGVSAFSNGKLAYKVIDRPVYYYFGWNADKELFGDKRVRQAMTYAFDRQRIIKDVLHGLGNPISGPMLPSHPGNDPRLAARPFDLEKAKKLLEAAGWTDTDGDGIRDKVIDGKRTSFEFTMLAYDKPSVARYLAIFRKDLSRIGVAMQTNPVSWTQMQKKMDERSFDAFTGGWAMSWSVDPYQLWHSSQADVPKGSNRVGFRHERADQIIETLRVTQDRDERTKLLREFHGIIYEEQPYTFLYQLRTAYAWHPRLQNVQFQPLRPLDFSFGWYIQPREAAKPVETTQATPSQ